MDAEEDWEEEKEFSDDEVVDVSQVKPESEKTSSKQAKQDEGTGSAGLKAGVSTESLESVQTPVGIVMKRMRTKGNPAEVTPASKVRRQLFASDASPSASTPASTSKSTGKKQMSMKHFFSPSTGSEQHPLQNLGEDEPRLPPKKHEPSIADTIRAMLQSGLVTRDGSIVSVSDKEVHQLTEQMQRQIRKDKGGRPEKKIVKRGVAGGLSSNMRLKSQKLLRQDLPVAYKHEICETIFNKRLEFESQEALFRAMGKKFRMKRKRLMYIWKRRSMWKADMEKKKLSRSQYTRSGKGAGKGVRGLEAVKHEKRRASGGGAKIQFPHLYQKMKDWVNKERMHGHSVLKKHISWKYEQYLSEHQQELQQKIHAGSATFAEKQKHEQAQKQLAALTKEKNQQQRANHLVQWMGAKNLIPNLVTQISETEQQVRACLTWQQHDYQMFRIARMSNEDCQELFAQPEQAKKQKASAMMGFSDQIPLWVKKPSDREVFAGWELKTSAGSVKAHRQKAADEFKKKSKQLGMSGTVAEEKQLGDQEPDEVPEPPSKELQVVEHDGDEEMQVSDPKSQPMSGKTHQTVVREANVDKYRVTFEAHQGVLNWWAPGKDPTGVVLPGVLIVPGPHASLSNINEDGEWVQSESFEYMGQVRVHQAGQKVGRVLLPWRKLRQEHPHLLEHLLIMSQPSSNMDSILMAWQIRDMSAKYGLTLWQRDCFGAVFTDQVRQMQFLAHQVPASVLAKMTSALQLTDTDFSHEFKSLIRREVDETMRKKNMEQRKDEAAPSDQAKLSIYDMASMLHRSMKKMIEKNEEDQWVLKGLRRNGFLLMRPNQAGHMILQDEQQWCRDKPVGSSRISQTWLAERMSWVKEAGKGIEPPNWSRIEGAKELADLIEWSYSNEQRSEAVSLELEGAEEPEWVTAGQFQLPLELRRQLAMREQEMKPESRAGEKRLERRGSKRS